MGRGIRILFVLLVLSTLACEKTWSSASDAVFVRASLASSAWTLSNGLDVVLHPDASFRNVTVNVRYGVGSKDDPRGLTGLAHLVEHLTFRSKPDGKQDAFALLEEAGSTSHNAETSQDFTEYHATLPAEELPLALFIEAARMARPLDRLDESGFLAERSVVRNERREHVDNVPFGNMDDLALSVLFDGHPYRTPVIGFAEDLERATLADAKRFVADHYRPNNATLVVAGRFDATRTLALIRELFDEIPAVPVSSFELAALPAYPQNVHQVMRAGTDAPAVTMAWLAPPAGKRGWAEMVVAAEVLRGEDLGQDVRTKVVSLVSLNAVSAFLIHLELVPGASVKSAIRAVDDIVDSLASRPVGGDKARLIAQTTLSLERLDHRASVLQDCFARYGEADNIQAELHAVSSVTSNELEAAVHAYLKPRRRVTVEVRPTPGAPKAGRWP